MADRSPVFDPPLNSLPSKNDPQIISVGQKETVDWAFRKSQVPSDGMDADNLTIQHVPNGR